MEQEKSTWDALLGSLSSSLQAESLGDKVESSEDSLAQPINETILEDADQVECLRQLSSRPDATETTRTRLKDALHSLEFRVDQAANGVHKLSKLEEVLNRVVDHVSEDAAMALRIRDEAKAGGSDAEKTSMKDVLRALSRV